LLGCHIGISQLRQPNSPSFALMDRRTWLWLDMFFCSKL
jgi:hypothetical protein